MRIGLTGGVGSGKSTVAALFATYGAVVINADQIARQVVEPGTPGFDKVVAMFGPAVVAADGALDRQALAAIVFGDIVHRTQLNAIVHPLVGERVAELSAAAAPDDVVVYDVPLLVESDMADGFDKVVVVQAPVELRIARLAERGMPEVDARERMRVQATDEQRQAVADEVITNDGTRAELEQRAAAAWQRLAAGGGSAQPV